MYILLLEDSPAADYAPLGPAAHLGVVICRLTHKGVCPADIHSTEHSISVDGTPDSCSSLLPGGYHDRVHKFKVARFPFAYMLDGALLHLSWDSSISALVATAFMCRAEHEHELQKFYNPRDLCA